MRAILDFLKKFLIVLGLFVFSGLLTSVWPWAGLGVGLILLIVPGIAVVRPIKRLGLTTRLFSFAIVLFVGIPATFASIDVVEEHAEAERLAVEQELSVLKDSNPKAYLIKLRQHDEKRWLEELARLDPEEHRAELARIAEEEAERKAREEAERAERAAKTRARLEAERAEREAEAAEKREKACGEDGEVMAYVMSQEFVERRLRAPSTAEFPWATEIKTEVIGDCRFRVVAYVDAQNGFGALIRSYYVAVLEHYPERESWSLVSMDFDG